LLAGYLYEANAEKQIPPLRCGMTKKEGAVTKEEGAAKAERTEKKKGND
jgi:hypothetical protein